MSDAGCTRMQLLAQADTDGELGVAEAAELSAHLAGCADCRDEQAALLALGAELRGQLPRYAAPADLRQRVENSLRQPVEFTLPPASRRWPRLTRPRFNGALGAGVALALAASVALLVLPAGSDLADLAAASHIRALQPGHLTDVASTNQHTVKPWFDGKLDYAPPVRDFATNGFPLLGGRLDYLDGRAVAALVYGRDRHVIDLYVWPGSGGLLVTRVAGYAVRGWSDGGMRFLAVSDLNAADLAGFAALWRVPTP
jgi:anti-sigma factor RsiW